MVADMMNGLSDMIGSVRGGSWEERYIYLEKGGTGVFAPSKGLYHALLLEG